MPKGYSKYNQSGWKHKKKSITQMIKNRRGLTANEKNSRWKGNEVSYAALHNWIRNHYKKPKKCEKCGINPGKNIIGQTKLQWSNKTKKYLRDRDDWVCLCPSCHKKNDIKNKIKHRYGKKA